MSATPYQQLEQEWRRLHAFRGALSLLRWDAAVMMPRGSADVRGEQLAALETEHHALLTAPTITRLLDRAQANAQGLEDWQLANLREMRRQRDHAIATPVSLISRLARATSRAESALGGSAACRITSRCSRRIWRKWCIWCATRRRCSARRSNLPPYDALVDEFSPGISHRRHRHASSRRCRAGCPALIREALASAGAAPVAAASAASSPPASSARWWSK